MPFTPAHAAVVLPFIRSRYFSATALVVGSMAPDFEYFFKMSVDGTHGHTWAGLFYFDLPVTVLLSFLFHSVVKQNLILNLPPFFQKRFVDTLNLDFTAAIRRRPFVFVMSALTGSASHIIWDGFTHGTGFFVGYFSFYKGSYVPFQGVNYPLWYALQYMSTYAGLSIALVYVMLMKESPLAKKPTLQYWLLFFMISIVVVSVRFLVHHSDHNLGNVVVSTVSAICVASIACGFVSFKSR